MKDGYVKSSPRFFSMILRSMGGMVLVLAALAAVIPAPLQTAADPAMTPNPVKSAWFLLWIQELVSWSRLMIWVVVAILVLAFLLPWLAPAHHAPRARWCMPSERKVWLPALLIALCVVALTLVALFLRGSNWSLVF